MPRIYNSPNQRQKCNLIGRTKKRDGEHSVPFAIDCEFLLLPGAAEEEDRAKLDADPLQVILGFTRADVFAVHLEVNVFAVGRQRGPADLAEEGNIVL